MLGNRLQLLGQMLLPSLHLLGLFGQIDGPMLLLPQQAVLVLQLATPLDGRLGKTRLLRAVTHKISRHIVGGFGDEIAEKIALGLGLTDGIQSTAVFVNGRLHVLERLAHTGVFRQQILAQGAGNG